MFTVDPDGGLFDDLSAHHESPLRSLTMDIQAARVPDKQTSTHFLDPRHDKITPDPAFWPLRGSGSGSSGAGAQERHPHLLHTLSKPPNQAIKRGKPHFSVDQEVKPRRMDRETNPHRPSPH